MCKSLLLKMAITFEVSTMSGLVANIRCSRGVSIHQIRRLVKAQFAIPSHEQVLLADSETWTDASLTVTQFLRGKTRRFVVVRVCMPCVACGQPAASNCSRCGAAWYCGTVCQAQDWHVHKHACIGAKARPQIANS